MIEHAALATSDDRVRQRLEQWLIHKLGNRASYELGKFRHASNGFSAETIIAPLTVSSDQPREIVIRLEQPGQEIFLDTDIVRQGDTMRALIANSIPAPVLIGAEADASVIGRRFLIMECAAGRTFPQTPNYNRAGWVKELNPDQRTTLWTNALSALGHANRLTAADGFKFLDRPHYGRSGLDQYLGWLRAWRDSALNARSHPVIDTALQYLEANRPQELPVGFVWGDSNPCNMLFNPDLSVAALLDFEAAALGPGEVDLGWWFFLDRTRVGEGQPLAGVPDRDGCIAIYEAALGRRVHAVPYFEILGGVRMSLVIVRTVERLIAASLLSRQTDAAVHNPMTQTLAALLGLKTEPLGESFNDFAKAVSAHSHGA